jgi:hypothetical protein
LKSDEDTLLVNQKSGCFYCGKELIYSDNTEEINCLYCKISYSANSKCRDGHYVCDNCHSLAANDIIEKYCSASTSTNPFYIAVAVMKHPTVKMHGPEHHFLVPAVLLTTHYNLDQKLSEKIEKIKLARKRAETIPGGSCGFHGNCGAAVGTGIFMSLIFNATPLSKDEWKKANMMTAKSLLTIAEHGGPRCCKRDTFLAIDTVIKNLEWDTDTSIKCEFYQLNNECLQKKCPYFG